MRVHTGRTRTPRDEPKTHCDRPHKRNNTREKVDVWQLHKLAWLGGSYRGSIKVVHYASAHAVHLQTRKGVEQKKSRYETVIRQQKWATCLRPCSIGRCAGRAAPPRPRDNARGGADARWPITKRHAQHSAAASRALSRWSGALRTECHAARGRADEANARKCERPRRLTSPRCGDETRRARRSSVGGERRARRHVGSLINGMSTSQNVVVHA